MNRSSLAVGELLRVIWTLGVSSAWLGFDAALVETFPPPPSFGDGGTGTRVAWISTFRVAFLFGTTFAIFLRIKQCLPNIWLCVFMSSALRILSFFSVSVAHTVLSVSDIDRRIAQATYLIDAIGGCATIGAACGFAQASILRQMVRPTDDGYDTANSLQPVHYASLIFGGTAAGAFFASLLLVSPAGFAADNSNFLITTLTTPTMNNKLSPALLIDENRGGSVAGKNQLLNYLFRLGTITVGTSVRHFFLLFSILQCLTLLSLWRLINESRGYSSSATLHHSSDTALESDANGGEDTAANTTALQISRLKKYSSSATPRHVHFPLLTVLVATMAAVANALAAAFPLALLVYLNDDGSVSAALRISVFTGSLLAGRLIFAQFHHTTSQIFLLSAAFMGCGLSVCGLAFAAPPALTIASAAAYGASLSATLPTLSLIAATIKDHDGTLDLLVFGSSFGAFLFPVLLHLLIDRYGKQLLATVHLFALILLLFLFVGFLNVQSATHAATAGRRASGVEHAHIWRFFRGEGSRRKMTRRTRSIRRFISTVRGSFRSGALIANATSGGRLAVPETTTERDIINRNRYRRLRRSGSPLLLPVDRSRTPSAGRIHYYRSMSNCEAIAVESATVGRRVIRTSAPIPAVQRRSGFVSQPQSGCQVANRCDSIDDDGDDSGSSGVCGSVFSPQHSVPLTSSVISSTMVFRVVESGDKGGADSL